MALPALREELDLFEGPPQGRGAPTWVLHDPVRQQFFQIDWLSFEILVRWPLGDAQAIVQAIARETPLQVLAADVERTLEFLAGHQLLRSDSLEAVGKLAERRRARQSQWWQWLIHHYLFFRIPLVKPDAWLGRMLPRVQPLFSRGFARLSAAALLLAGLQIVRQWERFTTFLMDTFTLQGLATYGLALIVVKTLHELGHAFALKRQGLRVPAMGVAFLVMWPMAYTDTNEAWKIADRGRRLQVSAAGIATEAALAAWALLAWTLLPDGALRSAMFFIGTVSLGLTLALNASPFMRFDGYFILCDWLDMPNLHGRSFALARWKLREWLFDLGEREPEALGAARQGALIAFAWAVWLYRLVLFLGIALMVYHLFTKLLGALLFAIEIYWFIWWPLRSELREWWSRRRAIVQRRRARRSAAVVLALLVLLALPLPTRITVMALARPAEFWPVHSPGPAVLQALHVRHGQEVAAGQAIARLAGPEVQMQLEASRARLERLQWQFGAASLGEGAGAATGLAPLALARNQLEGAQAEHERARQQALRYQLVSPMAGRFLLADPDLRPGQWLDRNERLGVVVAPGPWRLETWVDEEQARRLQPGARAHFHAEGLSGTWSAQVLDIDRDISRELADGQLTTAHGGHILVRELKDRWVPESAAYRVSLQLEAPAGPELGQVLRGWLSLQAQPQSLAGHYLRHVLAVLIREVQP